MLPILGGGCGPTVVGQEVQAFRRVRRLQDMVLILVTSRAYPTPYPIDWCCRASLQDVKYARTLRPRTVYPG